MRDKIKTDKYFFWNMHTLLGLLKLHLSLALYYYFNVLWDYFTNATLRVISVFCLQRFTCIDFDNASFQRSNAVSGSPKCKRVVCFRGEVAIREREATIVARDTRKKKPRAPRIVSGSPP